MKLIYVYYTLLVACFIVSLFHLKVYKVRLLMILLSVSIVTEAIFEVARRTSIHAKLFSVYHIFTIIEYTLITLILRTGVLNKKLKKIMLLSIPAFAIFSLCVSFSGDYIFKYPSINTNIETLLIIAWCLFSFFYIEPDEKISIYKRPDFWVCLAFFIYFSGTISINGVYNYLTAHKSLVAAQLYDIINSSFNYLMYIFLIFGIICYRWETK